MKIREFDRPHAFEELRNEVEDKNETLSALIDASSREDFNELCYAARRHGLRWVDQKRVEINAKE